MTTLDPDIIINPALSALEAVSYRQQLVSNNIANAQTPGYVAKTVGFSDLLSSLNDPFQTGLSKKMGASMAHSEMESGPVSLQKELIDMQKNLLFYNMATRRLTTVFNNMRAATQTGR